MRYKCVHVYLGDQNELLKASQKGTYFNPIFYHSGIETVILPDHLVTAIAALPCQYRQDINNHDISQMEYCF